MKKCEHNNPSEICDYCNSGTVVTERDLFVRRAYTHAGITVIVEIDFLKRNISLVEGNQRSGFKKKNWLFAERELEYMNGWQAILQAMQHAIAEATKVLKAREDEDVEDLVALLAAVDLRVKKTIRGVV